MASPERMASARVSLENGQRPIVFVVLLSVCVWSGVRVQLSGRDGSSVAVIAGQTGKFMVAQNLMSRLPSKGMTSGSGRKYRAVGSYDLCVATAL
jgi:hypothetical protein